jgi:transcriptional regulator with XRE-family HTH domain
MEWVRETMGERVKELLRARGWKQATLAELARVTTSYLSRLLSGKRRWTPPYVEAIARAFEIPPASLVEGTEAANLLGSLRAAPTAEEASSRPRELADAEARLREVEAEAAALRARNAELTQEVARLGADIERLEGVQQRLRALVEVLEAHFKSQYQTLTARDAELKHLREERRVFEAELDAARRHAEEIEQQVVQRNAELAWIRGSEEATQAIAMLHGYAAKVLAARVTAREAELSLRDQRIAELTENVERLRAALAEAEQRAGINYQAWMQVCTATRELQRKLEKMVGPTATTALLTGVLAFGAGVLAGTTGSPRALPARTLEGSRAPARAPAAAR